MAKPGRRTADDQLLLALACGATLETAAAKAGVSLRTAKRRLADPDFEGKLKTLRWEMVQRASGMMTASMGESIKTLIVLQKEPLPPTARLGAARAILEIGLRVRDQVELEQRLAHMEAQMTALRNERGNTP
jgi:hypothetical protein